MAKNGFKLIDAEMHVMEPVDLWQRYIDPEFGARAAAARRAALGHPHPRRGRGHGADAGRRLAGPDRRRGEGARRPLRRGNRAQLRPRIAGPGDGQGGARPGDPLSDIGDVRDRLHPDGPALRRGGVPRLQRLAPRLHRGRRPEADVRRRRDLAARRRERGRRDPPRRDRARHEGRSSCGPTSTTTGPGTTLITIRCGRPARSSTSRSASTRPPARG